MIDGLIPLHYPDRKLKLIAGLGNPGPRYLFTRHNAGFMVLDYYLSEFEETPYKERFSSPFAMMKIEGAEVAFIKPYSYMNKSGGPILQAIKELGVSPEDLLVIHDDIDIPPGETRFKIGGGHGGHNGLKSVVSNLGTSDFKRIRIGMGRPPEGVSVVDYVLGEITEDDKDPLRAAFEDASQLIENRFLQNT
jgi:PTH1 family peptidyl-tRNA hydrolase